METHTVISVTDEHSDHQPIRDAKITVAPLGYTGKSAEDAEVRTSEELSVATTDADGQIRLSLSHGRYRATADVFGYTATADFNVPVAQPVSLKVPIGFEIKAYELRQGQIVECDEFTAGDTAVLRAFYAGIQNRRLEVDWHPPAEERAPSHGDHHHEAYVDTAGLSGPVVIRADLRHNPAVSGAKQIHVKGRPVQPISGTVGVNLRRSASHPTADQALWVAIRTHTRAISFSGDGVPGTGYRAFIDRVLCEGRRVPDDPRLEREISELGSHVQGVAAYELLKTATEVFLLLQCGVNIDRHDRRLFDSNEEAGRLGLGAPVSLREINGRLRDYLGDSRLPYIDRVIRAAFPGITTGPVHCSGVLTSRADCPCLLELIWSYWHEEGMLVQSINAVSRRFQNVRGPGDRDPLAHLEIDPLRPLNNLLWGHVQGEWHRLTVKRRAYEYDHHYGLTLYGKAVPSFRPADSRSKFLEGFHNLLYVCSVFFKEDNDTTVIADGYPLLNALKEVHLLLAQGAHNQFGDLPWTARAEMLIQEWLLARPEMRDFLQSRAMVPYKEGWMPQVDTMKTLQGWSDVTVTHFSDLGVYGEQLLLSIRYGDWIGINDEDFAKNWARYWRPEVQGYLHAYRAATGVDLTNPDTVDSTMPSVHLQKRLASQRSR